VDWAHHLAWPQLQQAGVVAQEACSRWLLLLLLLLLLAEACSSMQVGACRHMHWLLYFGQWQHYLTRAPIHSPALTGGMAALIHSTHYTKSAAKKLRHSAATAA
jgi:hypothetical protein